MAGSKGHTAGGGTAGKPAPAAKPGGKPAAKAGKHAKSAGKSGKSAKAAKSGVKAQAKGGVKRVRRGLAIGDVMKVFAIAENTVRRDVKAGVPCSRIRGRLRFNEEEYRAWREAHGRTGKRGRPVEEPETPELADVKLRKLVAEERIKRAQADRDERKAEIERGSHQKLEDLRDMLVKFGGHLRAMVERMQKRFGPECAMMFNEGLDEFDGMVREHTGKLAGTENGGGGQAAAVAAPVR